MVILLTGAAAVLLSFLVGDFAERVRGLVYQVRREEKPESGFQRAVTVILAVLLLSWVLFAYS